LNDFFCVIAKTIDWDNLNWEKNYSRIRAYALSKLENVLFTVELHRRLRARGWNISTFAVHPGLVRTELGRFIYPQWVNKVLTATIGQIVAKTAEEGAQVSFSLCSFCAFLLTCI
jgi:NAD(P)-dependent dehydrogenase (short-subunit alcohol dehydrogenase family)